MNEGKRRDEMNKKKKSIVSHPVFCEHIVKYRWEFCPVCCRKPFWKKGHLLFIEGKKGGGK